MARVEKIILETASAEVKKAVDDHVAQGYRITNEKLTLLHNVTAFQVIEEDSYKLDRELQRLIGKRAADFYEYAISVENECLVCTTYFGKLLRDNGIDFENFEFTHQEDLLIQYGRALAKNPKEISEELIAEMKKEFNEEQMVVITAMGVMMIANNYFNDALEVESELLGK